MLILLSALPLVYAAVSPGYFSAPVKNCGEYYCTPNVSIGIPVAGAPQFTADFVVDTGSGEFWIHAGDGGFNINNTVGGMSNIVNNSFAISYTDGVSHTGFWQEQTVSIANVSMKSLMGGVDISGGAMMGLGPIANDQLALSNVLQAVIDANLTATPAFSLYLDPTVALWSDQQNNGEVLFGAVDASRFQKPLTVLPMLDSTAYHVTMDSVQVQADGSGNYRSLSTGSMRVLLDSGMPSFVLPGYLADAVAGLYGATSINGTIGTQNYGYTCDSAAVQNITQGTLLFTFGSASISVPLSSLVIDPSKNGSCILAIANAGNVSAALFGNPFLRNTYTVFDPSNRQVAMAQAVPAGRLRNILAITNATIPFVERPTTTASAGTNPTATANNAAVSASAQSRGTPAMSAAVINALAGLLLVGCVLAM